MVSARRRSTVTATAGRPIDGKGLAQGLASMTQQRVALTVGTLVDRDNVGELSAERARQLCEGDRVVAETGTRARMARVA